MDQEEASGPTLPHSTFGWNIMVKLKVCLFIPCFYVFLNSKNPCSIWCTLFIYINIFIYIYIYILNLKKNLKISKSFPKKRKIFKKKKFFELGALAFLVTFSKRPIFFLSKISRFFKVFFSKWYIRIPWTKLFLNCDV